MKQMGRSWSLFPALLVLSELGMIATASQLGCNSGSPSGKELTVLSLIAGEVGMYGNVDGTGPAARFQQPWGVAADKAGNLYVSDSNNNTVRKVALASGLVSTVAGGPMGFSGSTDGVGTDARFNGPWGMAIDSAGNLYVADQYNHTIRKVVLASGAVSTLAGTPRMIGSTDGTGSAARFYEPQGVALDGAGNLYVADSRNRTIRKVVLASGAVTTLAGTVGISGNADGAGSSARFGLPTGLAVDGAGNLYVADLNLHKIRKVELASAVVSTLAGGGTYGGADGVGASAKFSSPEGIASDGAGNLYVADTGNHAVRKVELAGANVTTIVGTMGLASIMLGQLPGGLNDPTSLAVLPSGAVVIVDSASHVVLEAR